MMVHKTQEADSKYIDERDVPKEKFTPGFQNADSMQES